MTTQSSKEPVGYLHTMYADAVGSNHGLIFWKEESLFKVPVFLHPPEPAKQPLAFKEGSWYAAEDVDRLVRELDVLLNGEDGAAPQSTLADIIAQLRKAAPLEKAAVHFPTMLRQMWSGGQVQQWLDENGPFYRHPRGAQP